MTKTNVQSIPSNSQHHDTPNNKTHVIKFRVTAEEKASLELTCKLLNILHPELKVEPTPDADGVIRVPGKAPVVPFRKFESVYDSDAYPEDVRYEYVALEELTIRFRISFNYQLEQMPDNAQRDVILEIIHKHKDYLTSLEAALADVKGQTA